MQEALVTPSLGASAQFTSRQERLLLLMLAGVQFTHIMDFMIMMPLGPQLMRLFSITPREFGFLVSAYTFSAGIFGFLGAFFVDRFDRKQTLLFAYIGFTVGTIGCALSPSYIVLMMARSFAGAFGGVLGAQIMAIIGDAIPSQRRGRAMGIVMASFSIASVFGVPFGLFLATQISWHAPFFLVGLIAALISFLIFVFVPPLTIHLAEGKPRASPAVLLGGIWRDKNQLNALCLMIFLMMGQFLLIPFLSPYMVSNVGFREDQLHWIYFVGGGLTIFTSPLVGKLADRHGKQIVFTIAGSLVLIPLLIVTHLGPTAVPVALIVTAAFFIFNNSRFIPAMAMITSTVRPATRGGFMSINSSVQSLSSGVAALLAGLVVERAATGELTGYGNLGLASAVISIFCIFLGRRLKSIEG